MRAGEVSHAGWSTSGWGRSDERKLMRAKPILLMSVGVLHSCGGLHFTFVGESPQKVTGRVLFLATVTGEQNRGGGERREGPEFLPPPERVGGRKGAVGEGNRSSRDEKEYFWLKLQGNRNSSELWRFEC